jgi:hypothetical protein
VGLLQSPLICGYGGFARGTARLPSRAVSIAVSSPGTAVQMELKVESGAQDILAEIALGTRLVDRALHAPAGKRVFGTHEDVGGARLDRESADDSAFDQLVRVALHQQPVLEGAGLHLVGVNHEVFACA